MSKRPTRDEAAPREHTLLSDDDLHLFNEGTHLRLHDHLGSHPVVVDGVEGVVFGVWAPNAERVAVLGDFNGWDGEAHPLAPRGASGIWEAFVPGVRVGDAYKYRVWARGGGHVDKADPFAVHAETPPRTASKVWELDHDWGDDAWMATRGERQGRDAPISIYELHAGSWRRVPDGDGERPMTYRELAEHLPDHVADLGFTHVEFLPLTEHPFYGSWGYQTTGYFAATSRYGTPQDLMHLVDRLHQRGIGVVMDWVPSHFPSDEHGLAEFDGTHLYEHADPKQGYHPDWKSQIFNYGRHEVRSFLLSSAMFWLDRFHVDALRVDAVASMLYLDYSRGEGEWVPNVHGGNENLEAIEFLRALNEAVYEHHPDVQTFAEESTAWPGVSRPTWVGGLGFGFKWDMGWMHDTLEYVQQDPVHRKYHHDRITFRSVYAFSENYCLPLSHDEVVHGKGSLLDKMPGDHWQRLANLRLLYAYLFTTPGKKLLFMGAELGQWREWRHEAGLDWHLLEDPAHAGIRDWVRAAATLYRDEPALHELDNEPGGFSWISSGDWEQSVLSWRRSGRTGRDVVVVANFTPIVRENYRIGVPVDGRWVELANSDAVQFGGSGVGNLGAVDATPIPIHGHEQSLVLTLPPLGALVLAPDGEPR